MPIKFADALGEIIGIVRDDRNPDGMKQTINSPTSLVKDPQLNLLLNGMVDRTGGDLQKVHLELAGWFDNAMDQVGGTYKRKTQLWGFVIALLMAAFLNVSVINIGRTLWRRPMVARAIGPQNDLAQQDVIRQLNMLETLDVPIGWKIEAFRNVSNGNVSVAFGFDLAAGWLITAVATLFGAPFWFDVLQRIIRLKGSGPSPAEKKANTSATA